MKKVLILDYGSQFTQLIARRIRELKVYSEIQPFGYPTEKIAQDRGISGIILSGGPNSIYDEGSPDIDKALFDLEIPILGICYGLQIMGSALGGSVEASNFREYGRSILKLKKSSPLWKGFFEKETLEVWMSHGDHLVKTPPGFEVIGSTPNCMMAAIGNEKAKLYGLQFHPEVSHTQFGERILSNFLFEICHLTPDWNSRNFLKQQILKIKEQVGKDKVICGLSGGVDSAVTAALIHKAIGNQLQCVFVDHGLLRKNERLEVEKTFRDTFKINLEVVDAKHKFLNNLKGIADPEEKRKVIGKTFIDVFNQTSKSLGEFKFLAQGTLYPDVVESQSFNGGPSHTIKSHHNVGGLPLIMPFKLVEPLKELFKDEVRKIGKSLKLPDKILWRHPFPGPGLAIRIISEVTEEKIRILQDADEIFINELKKYTPTRQEIKKLGLTQIKTGTKNRLKPVLYDFVWQAFCVLTPIQSVGVMGDGRTYENLLALRAVTAIDGMTADWARLPYDFLADVSNKIINKVKGINRVVYDISSKPPATIEWE